MKNLTLTVLFFLVLSVFLVFTKDKIGDVRPALLPPKSSIGENPSFPLDLPEGFKIGIFAPSASFGQIQDKSSGQASLDGVRDLEFSPGGVLLASIPSQGKVVALPDKNEDGAADEVRDIVTGLARPHGLAFHQGKLFIAQESRVVRYNWDEENLKATEDKVLFSLPGGGRHFTRTIAFNKKGQMFVSVGSSCDVCFEKHPWLGSVIVSDSEGNNPRIWAKGLRNSVFITVNPQTDELWGTEMGRDFLGDNLPPDEVNIIRESRDYGWPLCYGNRVHDTDFDKNFYIQIIPQPPCGTTEPPVYEIPAHSAPLGLVFIDSPQFPASWQGDLLVSYHGSWNRSTPVGYKIVRIDVEGNTVLGEEDFISGFLPSSASGAAQAYGRPVDLIFDKARSLFISDDKAGVIYKVIRR